MPTNDAQATPFALNGAVNIVPLPGVSRLIERAAERALGLDTLARMYRELPPSLPAAAFIDAALARFSIDAAFDEAARSRIPASGPTIVVANHPFGAIEGLVLARMLLAMRNDVRVLTSHLLTRIPELAGLFIGVDNFADAPGCAENVAPLRHAVRWLRGGGLLLVFPAGAVSHFQLSRRRVADPSWRPSVGRLVQLAKATVVPVFVHGANSHAFHVAGLVHARLRTAMLPRELLNKTRGTLRITIGEPIAVADIDAAWSAEQVVRYLRMRTYLLGARTEASGRATQRSTPRQPVAPPIDGRALVAEVAALPASAMLVANDRFRVYCALSEGIPNLLQDIGRLRELAFRGVGEGTGRASDLDLYDAYYRHLFVWDGEQEVVVGAYRLAFTDEVLKRFGPRGLYTQSLFRFGRVVVDRLDPAIELGRSFIRPEYQRSPAALMLLWQGIGRIVAASPRHATLFGAVSISDDYSMLSRRLLVDFLGERTLDGELAGHVKPRRPFRPRRVAAFDEFDVACLEGVEQVSRLVATLEPDGKGMPVLLRQYLKLGGRVLGFNTDARFNHALDALVVVDLRDTPARTLARYLGEEGARAFSDYHASATRVAEAS